jgi:Flp pilus assembly protein TadD
MALRAAAALYLKHQLNWQAVPVLERLVQLEPSATQARTDLAAAYAATGRLEEAEEVFNDELRLNPNSPSAFLGLGNLYLRTMRVPEALALLSKAAELTPNSYEPRFLLGSAYNHLERFEEAVGELEQALRISRTEPEIYYQLAKAYGRLGRLEDRKRVLAQFADLKSKTDQATGAQREAARLLEQINPLVDSGDLKKAIELLERARTLDPKAEQVLFRLAGLYYDT